MTPSWKQAPRDWVSSSTSQPFPCHNPQCPPDGHTLKQGRQTDSLGGVPAPIFEKYINGLSGRFLFQPFLSLLPVQGGCVFPLAVTAQWQSCLALWADLLSTPVWGKLGRFLNSPGDDLLASRTVAYCYVQFPLCAVPIMCSSHCVQPPLCALPIVYSTTMRSSYPAQLPLGAAPTGCSSHHAQLPPCAAPTVHSSHYVQLPPGTAALQFPLCAAPTVCIAHWVQLHNPRYTQM